MTSTAIRLKKLFKQMIDGICEYKYGSYSNIRHSEWSVLKNSDEWNGQVCITDTKIAFFIDKDDLIFDFKNIKPQKIDSATIKVIVKEYRSENMTEACFECIKRISTNVKNNDEVAMFYLVGSGRPIHIRMEYLKSLDIGLCRFYTIESVISYPVVITDSTGVLVGVVMPLDNI